MTALSRYRTVCIAAAEVSKQPPKSEPSGTLDRTIINAWNVLVLLEKALNAQSTARDIPARKHLDLSWFGGGGLIKYLSHLRRQRLLGKRFGQ